MPVRPLNNNYEQYLSPINTREKIRSELQDKIEQVWDYAPDLTEIEVQDDIGSDNYTKYKVRATKTFNPKTQDSRADDWKEFLFKERIREFPYGLYVKWQDNFWIIYNKQEFTSPTSKIICRRCQTTFNWLDEWGNVKTYPVAVSKPKEASDFVNVQFNTPAGFLIFWLQQDSITRLLKPGDKFAIGNGAWWNIYRIFAGGLINFQNEKTLDRHSAGLLQLICGIDEKNEQTISNEYGIVEYTEKQFTIELDRSVIDMLVGQTTNIKAIVKRGLELRDDVELEWRSDDSAVFAVSNDGNIHITGSGNATLTVSMIRNPNVKATAKITGRLAHPVDEHSLLITPDIDEVKRNSSITYTVKYYKNDIEETTNMRITLNRNGVPREYFKFSTNNNQFTISSIRPYSIKPLIINIESDNASISKEIWLTGEF